MKDIHFINEKFDPMVDDPGNYRYGIFYFNRNDRRRVVTKRNRLLGVTFNFAHPYAWWWVTGISFFLVFSLIMSFFFI
jgi:uncharacterized membrane protein